MKAIIILGLSCFSFVFVLCGSSNGISFIQQYEAGNPSIPSEFFELDLKGVQENVSVPHPMMKRDAYETLRELSSNTDTTTGSNTLIVERRLYNTSLALTIPFFSFKIPHVLRGGFLVNQALFGIFVIAIYSIVFAISFLFTGIQPSTESSRSMKRLANAARSSNFNFMGSSFTQSFGMDGLQCLQKVICQCHRTGENKRYGIFAKSIQHFIPAPNNGTLTTGMELSAFRSAARNGKYSNKDCDQLYDCILDPLGSARFLAHWYGQNHRGARTLLRMMDFSFKDLS